MSLPVRPSIRHVWTVANRAARSVGLRRRDCTSSVATPANCRRRSPTTRGRIRAAAARMGARPAGTATSAGRRGRADRTAFACGMRDRTQIGRLDVARFAAYVGVEVGAGVERRASQPIVDMQPPAARLRVQTMRAVARPFAVRGHADDATANRVVVGHVCEHYIACPRPRSRKPRSRARGRRTAAPAAAARSSTPRTARLATCTCMPAPAVGHKAPREGLSSSARTRGNSQSPVGEARAGASREASTARSTSSVPYQSGIDGRPDQHGGRMGTFTRSRDARYRASRPCAGCFCFSPSLRALTIARVSVLRKPAGVDRPDCCPNRPPLNGFDKVPRRACPRMWNGADALVDDGQRLFELRGSSRR